MISSPDAFPQSTRRCSSASKGAPAICGPRRRRRAGPRSTSAAGNGAGTATLSAAGASPVVGVDPSADAVRAAAREFGDVARFEVAEPMALPYDERSFDLITCFGVLESAPDPEAVLDGIERAIKPDGLLLASLPSGEDPEVAETWRTRCVRGFGRRDARSGLVRGLGDRRRGGRRDRRGPERDRGSRAPVGVAAASDAELPTLEPQCWASRRSRGLEALIDSVSRWEERARGAEAEVAAMRWELRIAGEKLTALVQRLLELENSPSRRLRRRLSGEAGPVFGGRGRGSVETPPAGARRCRRRPCENGSSSG